MSQVQQLIEKVEQIAASRPSYSLPNFLPSAVVELGVLSALQDGGMSGTSLIRELSPLSRRASGYGVHYPLLHEMEATGILDRLPHCRLQPALLLANRDRSGTIGPASPGIHQRECRAVSNGPATDQTLSFGLQKIGRYDRLLRLFLLDIKRQLD